MSWSLLIGLVLVLGFALLVAALRRAELARMKRAVTEREQAIRQGSDEAQFQHPVVDLSRCLGCGTCVAACPEEGVLDLVHGQAMVVGGALCVGHGACERECPVDAITVTLGNLRDRNDVPVVDENLEAIGSPGLFLAGEVTAHSLVKTAIDHGTLVAAEVANRLSGDDTPVVEEVLDLCIVGAGPAGLACSLEAKRHDLHFATLEQETGIGGTVAKYPRRKLVVSQPVELPLHGPLPRNSYTKEQLIQLWRDISAQHDLPIATGEVFTGVERTDDGLYQVHTERYTYTARNVCLALGRRGVPRRLGVPGEELPKVAYSLLDANSYRDRRILVVGGGDSAVEAAVGLAEQPGNEVVLSYRKENFFRVRMPNRRRLEDAVAEKRVHVVFSSEVENIRDGAVDLAVQNGNGRAVHELPNDDVFVMAGGTTPIEMLERSGVSFDSSLHPESEPATERGSGLSRALAIGFGLALATLLWAVWHIDYYMLPLDVRPTHEKDAWLRPNVGLGLWLGILATVMVAINLLYLVRRSPRFRFDVGSLKLWMTSHVATGILALLCAMLHGAMAPGDSPGGHAFWALAVLLVTGAIGRYFYAYVPRAANGRELALVEVKLRLGRMSEEWDRGQREFRELARARVNRLIENGQWGGSFFARVGSLISGQRELRATLNELADEGLGRGVAEDQIRETIDLARRAHRTALMAAHFEDLRAVLGSWRYFHRWVAALMVLLLVVHVVHAVVYGQLFVGGVR